MKDHLRQRHQEVQVKELEEDKQLIFTAKERPSGLTFVSALYKNKKALQMQGLFCDRDRIRTCDLLLRRQLLYPAELRDLNGYLKKNQQKNQ